MMHLRTSAHHGYHCAQKWSRRTKSDAEVTVAYSPTRYRCGEFIVTTIYRLPDGTRDPDGSRRIPLDPLVDPTVCRLWDVLFDETALAQQHRPLTVCIRLRIESAPADWRIRMRTLARVAGRELNVVVKGTAPHPADL